MGRACPAREGRAGWRRTKRGAVPRDRAPSAPDSPAPRGDVPRLAQAFPRAPAAEPGEPAADREDHDVHEHREHEGRTARGREGHQPRVPEESELNPWRKATSRENIR